MIGILTIAIFCGLGAWCIAKFVVEAETRTVIISIAVTFVVIFAISFGICKLCSAEYVAEYKSSKQTIELALASNSITGFERAQIVTTIVEKNAELAKWQYRWSKWHGKHLSSEIANLQPIEIKR